MQRIPTPKMSTFLKNDFMDPLHLSANYLAHAIHVPSSRILNIIHDKRRITPDTSIRLGKFFGVSAGYFLRIQANLDLRNLQMTKNQDYSKIKKYAKV